MSVQVFDQLSELEEALTSGQLEEALASGQWDEALASGQWSAGGTAPPVLVEIVVDPRWLADLHDPSLVISSGFVGPDRRRSDRSGDVATGGRTHGVDLFRRLAQVVAMTLAVVIPLALINARSVPPATATPGTTAPTARSSAAPATHNRTARHTLGATPQRVARADAAHQRALARHRSSGAGASVAPAVSSASPGPSATPEVVGSQAAAPASRSASRAAREARSASRATAADARAAARAAAAQRRTNRVAARSANVSGRRAVEVASDFGVDQRPDHEIGHRLHRGS